MSFNLKTLSMFWPARAALPAGLLILTLVTLAACSPRTDEKIWQLTGEAFGTGYHISVVLSEDEPRLQGLTQGIETVLESVDASMSTWRPDSELSRFNQQADQGDWFEVSSALFHVLAASQYVAEASGGAFDITIGPVVNLWGFGPEGRPESAPEADLLAETLAGTGYRNIELDTDRQAIRALQRQSLDVSAIAKGYAVDAVAEYLTGQGIEAYLVEIGGEVRVRGRKPDGTVWRIAVEDPLAVSRQVNQVVALDRHALATSGDYRNYYESEGRRFSHTIDPETGRPVDHTLASVTVIARSSMEADAWATAFMVLGFETSMALATRKNMAAYFIIRSDETFQVAWTPAFSAYLVQ